MKLVITGGAGFVGRHVVDEALRRGHDVTVIDDHRSNRDRHVALTGAHGGKALFVDRTVGTQSLKEELEGAEAVIHLAAKADLRSNWKDYFEREELIAENVEGTMRLLEECPTVPFIFASSASVYGSQSGTEPGRGALSEWMAGPSTIESPYAASKLAGEALVAAYAYKRGNPWFACRFVNVVGSGTRHGVIGDFVRAMHRDGRIHAADDGQQIKSWVHVDDVAAALLLMAEDHAGAVDQRQRGRIVPGRIASGVYNITSAERISWWTIVDAMGVPRSKVTHEHRDRGAIGDPLGLWCDGTKLSPWMKCERTIRSGILDALAGLGWGAR